MASATSWKFIPLTTACDPHPHPLSHPLGADSRRPVRAAPFFPSSSSSASGGDGRMTMCSVARRRSAWRRCLACLFRMARFSIPTASAAGKWSSRRSFGRRQRMRLENCRPFRAKRLRKFHRRFSRSHARNARCIIFACRKRRAPKAGHHGSASYYFKPTDTNQFPEHCGAAPR